MLAQGKKCDFSAEMPKFQRNFAEPHQSSNTGRKFTNLKTKFCLELVRAETQIQKPKSKYCNLGTEIFVTVSVSVSHFNE